MCSLSVSASGAEEGCFQRSEAFGEEGLLPLLLERNRGVVCLDEFDTSSQFDLDCVPCYC
jgi:hypothetical protein